MHAPLALGGRKARGVAKRTAPGELPARPRCEVFPAAGRAILRSAGAALALDYGPQGGWHGDWDKLSFELFNEAGPLICDPGTYRYEESLHWSHFKHTTSHSTVTLEDRRQLTCCGRLAGGGADPDRSRS